MPVAMNRNLVRTPKVRLCDAAGRMVRLITAIGAARELASPAIFFECKSDSKDIAACFNQARFDLIAALKHLDSRGIHNFPVFAVVVVDTVGHLITAWTEKDDVSYPRAHLSSSNVSKSMARARTSTRSWTRTAHSSTSRNPHKRSAMQRSWSRFAHSGRRSLTSWSDVHRRGWTGGGSQIPVGGGGRWITRDRRNTSRMPRAIFGVSSRGGRRPSRRSENM